MKFLTDLFPVILFFAAYQLYDIYVATAVAIVASAVDDAARIHPALGHGDDVGDHRVIRRRGDSLLEEGHQSLPAEADSVKSRMCQDNS